MTDTIQCRFCQGVRPVLLKRCQGCGSPVENARDNSKPRAKRQCPKCQSGSYQEIDAGRYVCRSCQGVYEDDDFSFVDSRPDVNAEKLESARAWVRKRGGRR